MSVIAENPALVEQPEQPPSRFVVLMRTRPELVLAPVLLVVIIFGWEYSVKWLDVPSYILPPPSHIVVALWRGLNEGLLSRGGYWLHAGVTLWEVLLGFFIGSSVGLLLGTIISQFRI